MAKKYPEYLREEAVKRYLAGKRAADVAAEVGCSVSILYRWVYKYRMEKIYTVGYASTGWKKRSSHGKQEV